MSLEKFFNPESIAVIGLNILNTGDVKMIYCRMSQTRRCKSLSIYAFLAVGMSLFLLICGCEESYETSAGKIPLLNTPFEMHKIKEPSFPERTVSICDYGAISGGTTKNTKAFTEAINACAKAGGGKVLVPSGLWLTGAVVLKSNINLHLAEGAEICFSTDPNDYLPVVFTRWAGIECYNYSPLIYANTCTNLAITGTGRLIGQGWSWWHWTKIEGDAVRRLLDAGLHNVPIKERIFGTVKDALRPQFIQLVDCSDVLLEDFIVEDGPFWTIDLQKKPLST